MELYVSCLRSMVPHPLFLLVIVYCASQIPCSACLEEQYEYCQKTSTCGNTAINFPFGEGNSGCGLPTFQIDCVQGSNPVIVIHGRNYTVLKFHYEDNYFYLFRNEVCQFLDDPLNMGLGYVDSTTVFRLVKIKNWTLNVYKCDTLSSQAIYYTRAGKLKKCNAAVYYSLSYYGLDSIPGCSVQQARVEVGRIEWVSNDPMRDESFIACEESGGICGYNISDSTKPFVCYCKDRPRADKCPRHGRLNKSAIIIIGCSIGGFVLTAIAALSLTYYACKRSKQPPPDRRRSISKVEKFLKEYAYEMPTRYSSSELKRITNNFVEKLGDGGCGVVYKGKLRNGTLVAVKLLDRHRHTEAQFMNEVATIGRVHHVNLVRLLGYCFESLASALVYEYMVNGSLEKFIFAGKEKGQVLRWEQLYSIALGAAHGVAYLHHDCDKRIIHFDIKPHNILLDAEFTPKVSDFGLAKFCGKGDDHISMTAGRGTPGYVAPDVCDRDVGPDSFGMLLLEIVGGRKNINWKASRSSQLYFPELAFKLLETGELGLRLREGGEGEMEAENEEKAMRLAKIGLWCIQYNHSDRPCMSRVVQMLEGNGDDVSIPPSAFYFSSAASEPTVLSSTEESCSIEILL